MLNCFVQLGELMRPENVQVSPPKTKKESRKVSWNGTWPPETVFIIFERWHKKGMSAAQGTSQGWREFKQVQITSVEGTNIGHC